MKSANAKKSSGYRVKVPGYIDKSVVLQPFTDHTHPPHPEELCFYTCGTPMYRVSWILDKWVHTVLQLFFKKQCFPGTVAGVVFGSGAKWCLCVPLYMYVLKSLKYYVLHTVNHTCIHTYVYGWIHERIDQSFHIGSRGHI